MYSLHLSFVTLFIQWTTSLGTMFSCNETPVFFFFLIMVYNSMIRDLTKRSCFKSVPLNVPYAMNNHKHDKILTVYRALAICGN
jgi:hypothetical protein